MDCFQCFHHCQDSLPPELQLDRQPWRRAASYPWRFSLAHHPLRWRDGLRKVGWRRRRLHRWAPGWPRRMPWRGTAPQLGPEIEMVTAAMRGCGLGIPKEHTWKTSTLQASVSILDLHVRYCKIPKLEKTSSPQPGRCSTLTIVMIIIIITIIIIFIFIFMRGQNSPPPDQYVDICWLGQ